jgi:integrase
LYAVEDLMEDRKHDKKTVMFEEGKNSKDLYNMWTKKVNLFLSKQTPDGKRKITTHDFRKTTATNLY